ncbi:hypothetical protein SDJN03_19551, partial [Cucurbita argyrosperma subsp. sororia]
MDSFSCLSPSSVLFQSSALLSLRFCCCFTHFFASGGARVGSRRSHRVRWLTARSVPAEAGTSSSKDDITGGSVEAEKNKLVFFEGGVYSFRFGGFVEGFSGGFGKRKCRNVVQGGAGRRKPPSSSRD